MGDAIKRTTVTTRHEYVLRSPTPVTEILKAINWAEHDMPEGKRQYDDRAYVEASDDEVIVWWEE